MPLHGVHEKDFGMDTPDGPVCVHDLAEGKIRDASEIFEGGVRFFMGTVTDGDCEAALRLTRKNMSMLPYWQAHPFAALEGNQATDAEFGAAMAKL